MKPVVLRTIFGTSLTTLLDFLTIRCGIPEEHLIRPDDHELYLSILNSTLIASSTNRPIPLYSQDAMEIMTSQNDVIATDLFKLK